MSRLVFGLGLGISSMSCALACATGSNGGGGGAAGVAGQTAFGGAAGSTSSGGASGGNPSGGSAGALVGGDGGATGGSGGATGGAGGSTGGSGGATGGSGGATGGSGGATGGSGGATGGSGGSGGTGGGPKGNCCTDNTGSTGCNQPAVEACVCAVDSYCCTTDWDDLCAGEVLTESCGTCPTPADCCAASSTPGCSSVAVENCVCDTAASCCSSGWSASCVSQVTSLGCGVCAPPPTGGIWINEIHYDDDLADAGEGVEIAGAAGTNLSGYTLVFYNGNPSQLKSYMTQALSGNIPNQQNGFGTVWFAKAGIQNGGADATPEPDGIALVNGTTVIQFLSYEGAFTPTDGAASGQASVNIGVSEISTTPDGLSLQLIGTGKQYSSFSWAAPALATPGAKNAGQTFN